MKCVRLLALISLLVAVLCVPIPALAGSPDTGAQDSPNKDLKDLYYDYQVWVAYDVVRFYVIAQSPQGKSIEEGFDSYDDAYDWASWLFFHDYTNVHIEPREEMSDWIHIGTWDTKAEALSWYNNALQKGFYAKIIPIHPWGSTRLP